MFVYGRPEHTRRTLAGLARANGARKTHLFVFCDGARGESDVEKVRATREVARGAAGFRSVTLIEREENLRGCGNIPAGVTEILDKEGRVIVVEDDVLPAFGFLDYMNAALDHYEGEKRVWHISGWNYPIDPSGLPPYFFWRAMNCWGWATWADRWKHYEQSIEKPMAWPRSRRHAFNLDGAHDFFSQVEDNVSGRLRTWDIFWYTTIFEHGGLCLNSHRFLRQKYRPRWQRPAQRCVQNRIPIRHRSTFFRRASKPN